MSGIVLPPTAESVTAVLEALMRGDLCVIPTDTVYGVAAIVAPEPVKRLFIAKGRPESRPIPVLVSGIEWARETAADWPAEAEALARKFWPGALTLVLAARPDLPPEVTAGTGNVGLRWPSGALVNEVIAGAGGRLAVTSANRSGRPPATDAAQAAEELGGAVAYVLDGGNLDGHLPSTVVSLHSGEPSVLRAGAVDAADIERALQSQPGPESIGKGRNT